MSRDCQKVDLMRVGAAKQHCQVFGFRFMWICTGFEVCCHKPWRLQSQEMVRVFALFVGFLAVAAPVAA